jgi:hypothetical protein
LRSPDQPVLSPVSDSLPVPNLYRSPRPVMGAPILNAVLLSAVVTMTSLAKCVVNPKSPLIAVLTAEPLVSTLMKAGPPPAPRNCSVEAVDETAPRKSQPSLLSVTIFNVPMVKKSSWAKETINVTAAELVARKLATAPALSGIPPVHFEASLQPPLAAFVQSGMTTLSSLDETPGAYL